VENTPLLLIPPIAFVVVFALVWLESAGFGTLSLKQPKGAVQPSGKFKAYACGQDVPDHRVQPDYGQFFPFAFFFTIMHVVALVLASIPAGDLASHGLALVYVLGATAGLVILYRGQA
jgi:NADH-quinone oxidoreductase subunit A